MLSRYSRSVNGFVLALMLSLALGGNAAWAGQALLREAEPNETSAAATPITGANVVYRANVFPAADVDFYSFQATAGDRIYAAVQTLWDASASGDSVLDLIGTDGTTVIENDPNDGTFGGTSSSIAGALIPSTGTFFLRVRHNVATGTIRPYDLHFNRLTGTPTPEVEANNTPATANPIPASGWVSGTISAVSPGESDFYSINLNAGDTVYLSLDMNPERDANVWNGRLGFALFGNPPANQIVLANDANAGATATDPNSEAFFFTVLTSGTYFVYVDSIIAAGLGANATYNLSVAVHPAEPTCTTYTSTDVPQTIPTGPGMVSSTITVPGNPRIEDLDISINLNHTFMQDIDAHLVSPAGNDNGLFTDIGAATVGGAQTLMDLREDDEAGLPPAFALQAGFVIQPELNYRLSWFDGENAGGTWTLVLRDDATGDGGTLNAWSITVCEAPPPPACAPGFTPQTVFSTDFESGDAGFTHSGTADQWARGLPATAATSTAPPIAAFTTCNSGSNCWKTNLTGPYSTAPTATNVTQDLLSPAINLAGLMPPVVVTWAQRYQMESANFDHMFIDAQQVGGATPVRLFEWLDATMTNTPGNPAVNIGESAGWGVFSRRADSLAGLNTELRFHIDTDNSVSLGGLAIDDVTVTACRALSADLSITKTDGVATATPGGSVTYTITAANAGPDAVTGATVADTFPATLTCNWTCVGAAGGTCAPSGSGNINDTTVNLPAGGSVTYSASCTISASATGTLSNTATVSSSVTDPTPGNNSATDMDTLAPMADVSITKTDGVTSVVAGSPVIYTITATNAGLSNAPGSTVADTFPGTLTCTWTCVGAGGGTCTGSGSGNINDTVNLPAGGSVTYTASCTLSMAATGTLTNTTTVAVAAGVTDPNPANNSATDVDTITAAQADLSITKTDGVTTVAPGGSVTYTIVASNAGPLAATGATVADTFAGTLTCTWTCAGTGGGTCAPSGSGNINDTVNLPVGGSVTYTASCTLSGSATGTLTNTATVTAPGSVADPNPGNNSATDTDTISAAPGANVTGSKTAPSGPYTVGGTVTYTVILTNGGTGAQADNPGNEFTDILPPTLALVSASATSGTAVASVGTNTVTWNGPLAAGGSVTITITATILPAAAGTTVNNQGTISYDSDGNGSNDGSRPTDNPAVGGAADPTPIVVTGPGGPGGPTNIPTLSEIGLLILAMALAGMALMVMKRRQARQ